MELLVTGPMRPHSTVSRGKDLAGSEEMPGNVHAPNRALPTPRADAAWARASAGGSLQVRRHKPSESRRIEKLSSFTMVDVILLVAFKSKKNGALACGNTTAASIEVEHGFVVRNSRVQIAPQWPAGLSQPGSRWLPHSDPWLSRRTRPHIARRRRPSILLLELF